MTPITIAGETLEARDWPEECKFFTRAHSSEERYWRGMKVTELDKYDNERKIAAAVARCYFLDKAAEAETKRLNLPDEEEGEIEESDEKLELWDIQMAYKESAEKWARISKGVQCKSTAKK